MERANPRLSLCMIVRNEAEMLPACLESVAGVADEIIIVDTGSTDATPAIAEAAGARVLSSPWQDDFSHARNVSLGAATGDWVLWMDADERLSPADYPIIRRAIAEAAVDAFLVQVVNHTPTGQQVIRAHRLFRNGKGVRFSGRIHEQVSPSLSAIGARVGEAPFTIEHLGYALAAERMAHKQERNLRLLELARAQNPRDAYIRFTLAQNHLLQKKHAQAEQELKAALGLVATQRMARPLPADIRAAAFSNLAECAIARQAHPEALSWCESSLKEAPVQCTAHLVAFQAYKALGRPQEALRALANVQRVVDEGTPSQAAIEVHVDRGDLLRAMGFCCLDMGSVDEAERYFQEALKGGTLRARTLAALARCAIARKDLDRALALAEEAFHLLPQDDALLDLISFILLKQGRYEEGAERLAQLCIRRPGDQTLRRHLAGALVRAGRVADAAAVLRAGDSAPTVSSPDPKATSIMA